MSADNIILLKSLWNNISKLFTGKKPPDEIIVIAKLKETNVLKSTIFKNKKIIIVNEE